MKKYLTFFCLLALPFTAYALEQPVVRRAAFDIGSGQIKMQISDVDLRTNKIVSVLLTDTAHVGLREDLAKSLDGRFSLDAEMQVINAISELVQKAAPFHPEAYHAIATESFRLAKNGVALGEQIKKKTGVPVTIISQEEEGILGFISAVSESNIDPNKVVCFDFGGGSFQITTKYAGDYVTYRGRFGKVPFKNALLNLQGKDLHASPNPVMKEGLENGLRFIKETIHPPEEFSLKLEDPDIVILGVGINPLWGMNDNTHFNKARILQEIHTRLDLNDQAIITHDAISEQHEKTAAYVVSNLILVHGVMDTFGFNQIHYVGTQGANAIGALLSPKYWNHEETSHE